MRNTIIISLLLLSFSPLYTGNKDRTKVVWNYISKDF